ncbi:MAG: Rrf2 family transcriptional regulator [Clostridia bacterium]
MKMSSKGRYGIYIAVCLAENYNKGFVPVSEIAGKTGVTEKYLEQILAKLKSDGIVDAMRGSCGGYKLSLSPDNITVGRVLRSLEDNLSFVDCLGGKCNHSDACVAQHLWNKLYINLNKFLDSMTLQQLLEDN